MITEWEQLDPHLQWIGKRLGQLGIEVRQPHRVSQMRCYLKLLKEEIEITNRFLGEGDVQDE